MSAFQNGSSRYLFFLLFLTASLENGDEVLVPASYKALGETFQVSVGFLGSLTFGRIILQTVTSPVIAPFIELLPKLTVIGLACSTWGLLTFATAMASSYYQVFFFRALTGICLAFAIPSLRSLMSTISAESNRAKGFSLLFVGSNIGALFWGLVATSCAEKNVDILGTFSFRGWRLVFVGFASLSILLGLLLLKTSSSLTSETPRRSTLKDRFREYYASVKIILRKKTFLLIALQGMIGSMPWKAFSYLPLILQRADFTGEQAASIVGCFQVGVASGIALGGFVADSLHKRFPDKGI